MSGRPAPACRSFRRPRLGAGTIGEMLGLVMVVVLVIVWTRRRLIVRSERRHQAEREANEAANEERERQIIAQMEEDFLRG